MDRDLQRLFAALAVRSDLPAPTDAEAAAALDLARVVARGVVRRGAPLVCYAAGLALGVDTPPQERARRLRELLAEAEALVAEGEAVVPEGRALPEGGALVAEGEALPDGEQLAEGDAAREEAGSGPPRADGHA